MKPPRPYEVGVHPLVRVFAGVMAAVFAYAAYLQLNDPDPLQWIAVYVTAGGLCTLAALNNPAPGTFHTFVIIGVLFWAAYLGSQVYGGGHVRPMYPQQRMTGNLMLDTEEGREMGGLLIIAATLGLIVGIQGYGRYRPARASDRRRSPVR